MDNLISRQAVIRIAEQGQIQGYEWQFKELNKLPSVTPQEPKTGHWIESRCDMWVCSNCGHTYTDLSGEKYGMNYCPNCGAKMESEENHDE